MPTLVRERLERASAISVESPGATTPGRLRGGCRGCKWSHDSAALRPAKSGDRILPRVFCHAYGERIVLLLGGYDKGADPGRRKQQREIARARARLDDFLRRQSSE